MDGTSRRRFGAYELDLDTGELRCEGRPVPLQRQPALVLMRLVTRAGALVPREDLQAAVWGIDVHVDFDRGLNYCIRQLRETLKDDARAPRFIETVARQGYRFVATLEPARVANPETVRAKPIRRTPRRLALVCAAVVVVLLGLRLADAAMGASEQHHQTAVAIARAIHDAVF
jgi:DNA-binding winged helix-turn-helix (wHTH) protein